MSIAVVSIPARDPSAAKAFHTDVAGFNGVHDEPVGTVARLNAPADILTR